MPYHLFGALGHFLDLFHFLVYLALSLPNLYDTASDSSATSIIANIANMPTT